MNNNYIAHHEYDDSVEFQKFRRQLFHSSLSVILSSLRPAMTTPEIVKCPDGRFRHAIYGLGPYIADYSEQVSLAGVVNNWCARYVIIIDPYTVFLNNSFLDVQLSHGILMVTGFDAHELGPTFL